MALGDFTKLQRGHDLPDQDRRAGTVPIMGSFGVTGYHDVSKAKGPGVTVGRSGASFGVVSYCPEDFWPLNTALYVVDFHGNHPRFAYYLLKTLDFTNFNSGSAQPSLNRNFIHPIPINVPPIEEQRGIAAVLGRLDDKIELNRRMNQTLEAMAQALFRSWFVDFDPVRAKAEGRQPEGMDSETAALFPSRFVNLELEAIPESWRRCILGEVIEVFDSMRVPLSGQEREQRRGPYPYYGAASVMDSVDDYLFDGIYVLMGEDGSVVDSLERPVLQYVWGQFWVNNHAHVLKARAPISSEHLLLSLKETNIRAFVTGAVQPKLNQANMKRIPFLLAPSEICARFARIIEPLFARLRANSDENKTLAALRDTLLPKLISGEMRVNMTPQSIRNGE